MPSSTVPPPRRPFPSRASLDVPRDGATIGVPRPLRGERRVGLVPATVRRLSERGTAVLVEAGAGARCLLPDDDYVAAGATIVPDCWAAGVVVATAAPGFPEAARMRPGALLVLPAEAAPRPCIATALDHRAIGLVLAEVPRPRPEVLTGRPDWDLAGPSTVLANAVLAVFDAADAPVAATPRHSPGTRALVALT